MAAYLGLVMHAAEGNAHAVAICGSGNAHGYARFAGSRRPDKAQKVSACLGCKSFDCKILYYAFLYLFKAEVIVIEHLARFFYIIGFGGLYIPRQLKANIEIAADDCCLGRAKRLLGKMRNLLEKLLFDLL